MSKPWLPRQCQSRSLARPHKRRTRMASAGSDAYLISQLQDCKMGTNHDSEIHGMAVNEPCPRVIDCAREALDHNTSNQIYPRRPYRKDGFLPEGKRAD